MNTFENKQQTDSSYTDFSKAFDKVNQTLLIEKLKVLQFRDCAL